MGDLIETLVRKLFGVIKDYEFVPGLVGIMLLLDGNYLQGILLLAISATAYVINDRKVFKKVKSTLSNLWGKIPVDEYAQKYHPYSKLKVEVTTFESLVDPLYNLVDPARNAWLSCFKAYYKVPEDRREIFASDLAEIDQAYLKLLDTVARLSDTKLKRAQLSSIREVCQQLVDSVEAFNANTLTYDSSTLERIRQNLERTELKLGDRLDAHSELSSEQ